MARACSRVELLKNRFGKTLDFLDLHFQDKITLTKNEEALLFSSLKKLDSLSFRAVREVESIFYPGSGRRTGAAVSLPYPANELHKLFYSQGGKSSKIAIIVNYIKKCKSEGLISNDFQNPVGFKG